VSLEEVRKEQTHEQTSVQTKEQSPIPPAPSDGPTPHQPGRDGKEKDRKPQKPGGIDEHDLAAAAYVASNPPEVGGAFRRLTDAERERLTSTVAKQLRAGITRSQINAAIGERNLEGANSVVAALTARINKLEPKPAPAPRRPVAREPEPPKPARIRPHGPVTVTDDGHCPAHPSMWGGTDDAGDYRCTLCRVGVAA